MPGSQRAFDIFFIYHPDDSGFVQDLARRLEAKNLRCWLDENEFGDDEDGPHRLTDGILRSYSVAMVLTPSSAASQLCNTLIEFAVVNSKRFVTLVVNEDIAVDIHPAIAANPYVFFREEGDFSVGVSTLVASLPANEHLRFHTELLVLAHSWDRQGRDPQMLLPPERAERARLWLLEGTQRSPKPSQLQVAFIHASRRQKPAPKRGLTRYLVGAFAAALVIGGLAFALQSAIASQVAATATAEFLGTAEAERDAELALASTATAQSDRDAQLLAELAATSGSIAREVRGTAEAQIAQATRNAAAAMTVEARATRQAANMRATETARLNRERQAQTILQAAETALAAGQFELSLALAWDVAQSLEQAYLAYPVLRRIAALSPVLSLDGIALARLQPGGRQLAVIPTALDRVQIYDSEDGSLLFEIQDQAGELTALEYSRDGEYLITAASDGELVVRDSDSGAANWRMAAHGGPISALAVSHDGARVFSAGTDPLLAAWDRARGDVLAQFDADLGEFRAPSQLLVSEDDSRLVGWSDTGGRTIMAQWAAETLDLLTADTGGRVYLGADPPGGLAYSGGRRSPAYAGDPNVGELRLWELDTGQPLARLGDGFNWSDRDAGATADSDRLLYIAFRGEDALVGVEDHAGRRRAVMVNLNDGAAQRTLQSSLVGRLISADFVSPQVLLSATEDGQIVLWSSADGRVIRQIGLAPDPIAQITVSDSADYVLGQTITGKANLWQIAAGEREPLLTLDGMADVSVNHAGAALLIVDGGGTQLQDVASGEILMRADGSRLTRMNRSGTHLAVTSDDAMAVYDSENGARLMEWPAPVDEIRELYLSPSGANIIFSDVFGNLFLQKSGRADPLRLITNDAGPALWLRFSPTGAFLSIHADRALLWDGAGSSPSQVFALGMPASYALDERFDAAFDAEGESLIFFARLDNQLAGVTVISLDGELLRRQTFVEVESGRLSPGRPGRCSCITWMATPTSLILSMARSCIAWRRAILRCASRRSGCPRSGSTPLPMVNCWFGTCPPMLWSNVSTMPTAQSISPSTAAGIWP